VGDKEEEMKAFMTMFMEIMGAGVSVYSTTTDHHHHHHHHHHHNDFDTSTNSCNTIINHPCGGNTNPNQTPSCFFRATWQQTRQRVYHATGNSSSLVATEIPPGGAPTSQCCCCRYGVDSTVTAVLMTKGMTVTVESTPPMTAALTCPLPTFLRTSSINSLA
jgi:hypothetical protein